MSVNMLAGVQGRKLCPEYMKFLSYDHFYTGTNWRMVCEKKNVVFCTYCLDVTKKKIQLSAHYGSSAGHLYQVCNYTAPDPEAGGARCNQWMDLQNGTCSCQPYHGKGYFYQTEFFKNFSGFPDPSSTTEPPVTPVKLVTQSPTEISTNTNEISSTNTTEISSTNTTEISSTNTTEI